MVMDKKQQYVKGNTALAPEKQEREPLRKEEYDLLRKSKIERANRLKHNKNIKKRKVLKSIAVIFVFGFAIMFNESKLYDRQQEITQINKQINEINKTNEDLRIQLVKLNGLNNIKDAADNKLQMVIPQNGSEVRVDFSKNNFAEVPRDDKESLAKEFLAKIKGLLF